MVNDTRLAISKWLGRLTLSICPKRGGFTAGFLHLLKAVPNVKQVGPQLYMSQRYGPRSVGCPSLWGMDAFRDSSVLKTRIIFFIFPHQFKVWFYVSVQYAFRRAGVLFGMWFLMPESGTLRGIDWGIHLVSLESYKLASMSEFEPPTPAERWNASVKDATKLYSSMIN